jgi:hypothetical protein
MVEVFVRGGAASCDLCQRWEEQYRGPEDRRNSWRCCWIGSAGRHTRCCNRSAKPAGVEQRKVIRGIARSNSERASSVATKRFERSAGSEGKWCRACAIPPPPSPSSSSLVAPLSPPPSSPSLVAPLSPPSSPPPLLTRLAAFAGRKTPGERRDKTHYAYG